MRNVRKLHLYSPDTKEASERLQSLTCAILPGRFNSGFPATSLYNQIFSFWLKFWENVLKINKSKDRIDAYDFLRSDFVVSMMNGDEIVSIHLYSIFNTEQANISSHPYLRGTEERVFLEALKERNLKTAMSAEYLTINPKWRKSEIGLSLAPVVAGLAYKLQSALAIDAVLGRCRQDVRSNVLMTDVGGVTLKRDVVIHNTPTDFCAVFLNDIKSHPDLLVREMIERVWSTRVDWTRETTELTPSQTKVSKAA